MTKTSIGLVRSESSYRGVACIYMLINYKVDSILIAAFRTIKLSNTIPFSSFSFRRVGKTGRLQNKINKIK